MAKGQNNIKNTFKPSEDTENNKKKVKKEKKSSPLLKKGSVKLKFSLNEKSMRIAGLLLLLLSVIMLLSFISFLFTWKYDMAYPIDGQGLSSLAYKNLMGKNFMGKFGNWLAELFIYKSFGIASLSFSLISFVYGFQLISGIALLPLKKMAKHLSFLIIWTSILCSFIFYKDNLLVIGGNFGYQAKLWLISLFGIFGTALIMAFTLLGYSVISFNNKFTWINRFLKTPANNKVSDPSSGVSSLAEGANETEDDILLTEEEANAITLSVKDSQDSPSPNEDTPFSAKESSDSAEIPATPDSTLTSVPETATVSFDIPTTQSSTKTKDSNEGEVSFSVENPAESEDNKVLNDDEIDDLAKQKVSEFGEYDPRLDLSNFVFPSIDLLEQHNTNNSSVSQEELEANKNRIVETLGNYGIKIAQIKATIGPTVTLYEIIPEAGVRISKIKNLEDDIALSLAALGIRIIAPIPGKGTIGIEVPNQTPEIVSMRSVISSEKFQNSKMELPIVIGKTITNETHVFDLAKMPHVLMAGATGQGKSVGLNAMLTSLLYKKHPAELKFVLVDPKKVELTLFNKIERHYLAKLPNAEEAIITENKTVVNTLNSLCIEMDNRYNLLKDAMVRNIKEYNGKFKSRKLNPENGHRYLPYIVVVVDEFADLIQTAGRDVEGPIARIAQLARAVGIHLIIATQRPSVNVITGLIKANFPARIAFRVTSKIDSRTILDSGGADQLIGRGDLLFSTGSDLTRIQCAFVDTPEVEKIADFIGSQKGYPDAFILPEVDDEQSEGNAEIDDDRDTLFPEAARVIVQHQQGSTSLIQRKLKLGYNRAGRIIDQLEAAGIVGGFEGSKAREVKIKDITTLEQLLNELEN